MLKTFLLLFFVLTLSFGACFAKTTLSVMDLSASGITVDEAKTLTFRLIAELDKLQGQSWFTLVATEKRERIIKELTYQQTGLCDQATCIAEFGRQLGAQKMIGGNVGKVGQTYSVTLILVDVASVKVDKTAMKDYKGDVDGLLDVFSPLAATIVGKDLPGEGSGSKSTSLPDCVNKFVPDKTRFTQFFELGGEVDWQEGVLVVRGIGVSPLNARPGDRMQLAIDNAKYDAQKNMLVMVKSLRLSRGGTIGEAMAASKDLVKKINDAIQGGRIVRTKFMSDKSIEVDLSLLINDLCSVLP